MKIPSSKWTEELKSIASKGFFHLFTAQGLVIVVGFASQLFVAAFLDPVDIGRIKIMQTYVSLATIICGLGFNTSLLKLASEERTVQEKKRLYQTAFVVTFISFTLLYAFLWLLSARRMVSADDTVNSIFPLYALFLLPISIQSLQLSYYQAKKEFKRMASLQLLIKIASVSLIIIFTFYFQLEGYVVTIVATGFIAVLIFEMGLGEYSLNLSSFLIDMKVVKAMFSMAALALVTNIIGTLNASLDIYLINYLVTDRTEVGFYMFALTIIGVYQIFPSSIQQIAFPYFSAQSNDRDRWFRSYRKYNRLNHLSIPGVLVAGLVVIPILIQFAFDGRYDRSIHYFFFLSIAWTLRNLNIMKPTALMGYGRFDLNFFSALIALVFSFPILSLLIRSHDLEGALVGRIICSALSYLVTFIVFVRFIKERSFAV